MSILGWVGNLFIVAGLWGVGNKRRGAFVFSVIGETAWIAKSALLGDWALCSICVVFLLMAVRGYWKWR